MIRFISILSLSFFVWSCGNAPVQKKVNGVSLEMPPKPFNADRYDELVELNADWIAVIPYAFSRPNEPTVHFNNGGQWWGEGEEGTRESIRMAREKRLKVMLKPHVWVSGHGWPGNYDLKDEEKWLEWERSYRSYILAYAKVAQDMKVEILCVGTEYRKAAAQRPAYWRKLIEEVREIYSGQVTYAANWDNYMNVTFWDAVDFIGVDAYFPLSDEAQPQIETLMNKWQKTEVKLEALSREYDRQILFTEYGYKSIEYTNMGHWKYKEDTVSASQENQARAYEALYRSIWQKDWVSGGFFWKWHLRDMGENSYHEGRLGRRYTPQNKSTLKVIKEYYGKN